MSRDGSRVVTTSLDHTVRVWDAHTGRELRVLTFSTDEAPVQFSFDGSRFVVTCVISAHGDSPQNAGDSR